MKDYVMSRTTNDKSSQPLDSHREMVRGYALAQYPLGQCPTTYIRGTKYAIIYKSRNHT